MTGGLASIFGKGSQLLADPVLRRWAVARLLGRVPGAPAFAAHKPAYLDGLLPLPAEPPAAAFEVLDETPPQGNLTIDLAGTELTLSPGDETQVFDRDFNDEEPLLALHRFAWLPLIDPVADGAEPGWICRLWQAWMARFSAPDDSPAWHPYTAAERCVNILNHAGRSGLPGPLEATLALLAAHGPAIANRLEYFGDHNTSNHLANNGRGLYLLGLALGLPHCARLGVEILRHEGGRIFTAGAGVMREGSSHYHLLYTRNYLEVWLAAQRHRRDEADSFKAIAQNALACTAKINLPGGYPLIGDISPDLPPADLIDLLAPDSRTRWLGRLEDNERQLVQDLIQETPEVDANVLAGDGWLRADFGPWCGLWHVAPEGWAAMPGHGHQDLGGFELHYGDLPLFIDLGRGRYGAGGDAAVYIAAAMNNGLTIDGHDPYPPNKPYYNAGFRRSIVPAGPGYEIGGDHVSISHHGFERLGGSGAARSVWRFNGNQFTLTDTVESAGGSGQKRRGVRHLASSLEVAQNKDGMTLSGGGRQFHLASECAMDLKPVIGWRAYNRGAGATLITLTTLAADAPAPLEISVTVKVV